MVLMIPWVIFVLPESRWICTARLETPAQNIFTAKGVSLEDMDQLFGYSSGGNQAREQSPNGSINDDHKGDIVHQEVVNSSADRNV
jgi:hypothetical protein